MKYRVFLLVFLIILSLSFTVSANQYPTYSNESPTDDGTVHDKSPLLSVDISDSDGDTVDVDFFNDSDDSIIGSDVIIGSGTATAEWDIGNPSDDDEFKWYIQVNDNNGSGDLQSTPIWNFTYENTNPTYSNEEPTSGSSTHDDPVSLEINISDSDGDDVTVKFYDDSDDSQIGNDIVYGGSGTASTNWDHYAGNGVTLRWYISVNDGYGSGDLYSTPVWNFTHTNNNPTYSNEEPTSGSSTHDNPISLEIDISDSDGDDVAIAFYDDSDDSQIGNDIVYGGSGTASTNWDHDAGNGETLRWYVAVNDGHGSGNLYSTPVFTITYTNSNPTYSNEQPADDSRTPDITVTLEVDMSDSDGDDIDITFYDNSDDSVIGTDTVNGGSGTANCSWTHGSSDEGNNVWYIEVNDNHGSGDLQSTPVWNFTYYDDSSSAIAEILYMNTTFDIIVGEITEIIYANTTFNITGGEITEIIYANTTFNIGYESEGEEPTGNLTADFLINVNYTTFVVVFTDNSSTEGDVNITWWSWDLGDGRTASSKNVTHTYGINWSAINTTVNTVSFVIRLEVENETLSEYDWISKTIIFTRPVSAGPTYYELPMELIVSLIGVLLIISVVYILLNVTEGVFKR